MFLDFGTGVKQVLGNKYYRIVKTKGIILILPIVVILMVYVGGYFFVVHKRLVNPFISWPIMRPLPMEAYYRPYCLGFIYETVVRLDQKFFPMHWLCPPTPKKDYQFFPSDSIPDADLPFSISNQVSKLDKILPPSRATAPLILN